MKVYILSCLVLLKSILFNLLCVLIHFFFLCYSDFFNQGLHCLENVLLYLLYVSWKCSLFAAAGRPIQCPWYQGRGYTSYGSHPTRQHGQFCWLLMTLEHFAPTLALVWCAWFSPCCDFHTRWFTLNHNTVLCDRLLHSHVGWIIRYLYGQYYSLWWHFAQRQHWWLVRCCCDAKSSHGRRPHWVTVQYFGGCSVNSTHKKNQITIIETQEQFFTSLSWKLNEIQLVSVEHYPTVGPITILMK